MAKRNMQFRFQIYELLKENVQMNTGEIHDEMCDRNPKSAPPLNRMVQHMRTCKWFENIGNTFTRQNGALRHAIWVLKDEYREFPPQKFPRSSKLMHMGGKKEYEKQE